MSIKLSEINFPLVLNVTDQEIDISSLTEAQKQFYIDLFDEIVSLYESKNKDRLIVGLAGPIGAGKTVISSLFKEIAKQVKLPFAFESATIDAFHYHNNFLSSHVSSDGDSLKNHKGRFDTYDTEKLKTTLQNFSEGQKVSLPAYSRKTHEPVEDSIKVDAAKTLLLIEGLWLLSDKGGWKKIGQFLDFKFFVDADKEKVRSMVIARHVKGGRTLADAENFYDTVDSKNFDAVIESKVNADKIVPPYYLL
jgi:pantothenate kinase